jgi:hypothetical protein
MGRDRAPLPRDFPDRVIRDALLTPDNLRTVMRRAVPSLADQLDYARREVVSPAFLLDDWRQRDADVLVRIPLLGQEGRSVFVCILVEHQSVPDPVMPLRLLTYAVLFWERQWREWEQAHDYAKPLRLTPVVPVVFHTGQRAWNTPTAIAELFDGPESLRVFAPQWATAMWDLSQDEPAALLASDEAFAQAMAVVRAERAESEAFAAVVTEALQRLSALTGRDPVHWQQLARLTLYWSILRRPRAEWEPILASLRRTHENAELEREVETMAEQLGLTWGEELFLKGESRGELRALRRNLRQLVTRKFGSVSDDLAQRIEEADLPALESALEQMLIVTSPDELRLGTPPAS